MEKRDEKAVKDFIEPKLKLILEARQKVLESGDKPGTIYIGDIFPREKDELRPSAMNIEVGRVFGMKVVADFRIPKDTFYLTCGNLNDGRTQKP